MEELTLYVNWTNEYWIVRSSQRSVGISGSYITLHCCQEEHLEGVITPHPTTHISYLSVAQVRTSQYHMTKQWGIARNTDSFYHKGTEVTALRRTSLKITLYHRMIRPYNPIVDQFKTNTTSINNLLNVTINVVYLYKHI